MPLSEETIPYEVLLRFSESGAQRGKLSGALFRKLNQILKDGVILSSTEAPPEQLALAAGEDGQLLSDVLGEINAQTIIDNQVLSANLSTEQQTSAALNEQLIAAQSEIQLLTDQLAADADTANQQSEAQKAEIERLTGLLASPVVELEAETLR